MESNNNAENELFEESEAVTVTTDEEPSNFEHKSTTDNKQKKKDQFIIEVEKKIYI